jgi:biotin transport system substrate-specific component
MSAALAAPASSVDRLRSADLALPLQAALVGGTALLTAVLAQFELRIYLWEVPLTLQTLAVYGSGLVLGRRNGALAMALYLALGLALPFFAGGGTGLAHLLGASGGYLLAFPLVAFLGGTVTASDRSPARVLLALALGSVVLFASGATWLHVVADHATWTESIVNGWLRFVPWDLAKIGVVGSLYLAARRAL